LSLVEEVVVLGADADEVNGADVVAEEHPVPNVVRHREPEANVIKLFTAVSYYEFS
jgi:hypothetical protein